MDEPGEHYTNETSHSQKDKYCMISPVCGNLKEKKLIVYIEVEQNSACHSPALGQWKWEDV
jgi:hypothetical protein